MIVDNIRNYLGDEKKPQFTKIIKEIYQTTKHLKEAYPNYKKWFFNKQVKGCYNQSRNIIFVKNKQGKIVGICCLKKESDERKLCTLYVVPDYRMQGVGSLLLKEAINFLGTEKPLITFAEDILPMFEKIIKKYDWKLVEVADGIYKEGVKELCFNGKLSK